MLQILHKILHFHPLLVKSGYSSGQTKSSTRFELAINMEVSMEVFLDNKPVIYRGSCDLFQKRIY
jgi:hypothetical protein